MKKECFPTVLGAILIACFLAVGTAQAASVPNGRDEKKKIELTVVEKRPSDKPARSNEPRRQQPPDRRH